MKKLLCLVLMAAMVVGAGSMLVACGNEVSCGPGTTKSGSKCIPKCTSSQYWDDAGQACKAVPVCDTGTTFNATTGKCEADITGCAAGTVKQNGKCVPQCPDKQYWDGTQCQPVPVCGAGTKFNATTGKCEPDASSCARGTHFANGECAPNLSCNIQPDLSGTHPGCAAAGDTYNTTTDLCAPSGAFPICLPNHLPAPDVAEGAENNDLRFPGATQTQFNLPATVGGKVTLGGVIQAPFDAAGDGTIQADFDDFMFSAQAGTYLKITATSEGATLPAFFVFGIDMTAGTVFYQRVGLNPNALDASREVYLPQTGVYVLGVSDYTNIVNYLFQLNGVSVGGPDFTYFVTVEKLAAPTPKTIGLPTSSETGDFTNGAIKFFSVPNLAVDDILQVVSAGTPIQHATSDVFKDLMVFAPNGSFMKEDMQQSNTANSTLYFRAAAAGNYLVVQDYFMTTGPNKQFKVDFTKKAVTPQTGDFTGSLVAGGDEISSIALTADQVLDMGIYPPTSSQVDLRAQLFDRDMNLVYDSDNGAGLNAMAFYYALIDTKVFLRVTEATGTATAYDVKMVKIDTPALAVGANTGLVANAMPTGTLPNSGIDHIAPAAGQIALFTNFATYGTWATPLEQIYDKNLNLVGPAVDVSSGNPVDMVPGIAYAQTAEHLLHIAWDGTATMAATNTYDTTLYYQTPVAVTLPAAGQDVTKAAQNLDTTSGLAFYTFSIAQGGPVKITVTPKATNPVIQPAVTVLTFGSYQCFYSCWWAPDPTLPQLGLTQAATATAAGAEVSMDYTSPYEGLTVVMIGNANAAGSTEPFDVVFSVPTPPANDKCASAELLTMVAGSATAQGTTFGGSNDASMPDGGCTYYTSDGPDVFYKIHLTEGDSVSITLDAPSFDASLYLFKDCADAGGTCLKGSDNDGAGVSELIKYTVPTGGTGDYLIGVDSYFNVGGAFTLTVSTPPANDKCAGATPITLTSGSGNASGDTSAASPDVTLTYNDCTGYSTSGNDLFYSVALTNGQTITVTLHPTTGWDPALYLFTDCADVAGSCVAGSDNGMGGDDETASYTATAAGTILIGVDSYSTSEAGPFDLTITP